MIPEPYFQNETSTLYLGNNLNVLPLLESDSVDALVTDPPAGISFMSKSWDDFRRASNPADVGRDNVFGRTSARGPEYARRSRAAFVEFMTAVMIECYRVMKPGAHGLVWSIPRTSHWTAWALEDAGFEVRDRVSHLFGSGFPKSLDVSKTMEGVNGTQSKAFCAAGRGDRADIQERVGPDTRFRSDYGYKFEPQSDAAKQWEGWGTALKPAVEDWWLVRKPLIGTVAQNILEHGTGGLNIDGCRIETGESLNGGAYSGDERQRDNYSASDLDAGASLTRLNRGIGEYSQPLGRWPANLVLSHSEGCELIGRKKVASNGHYPSSRGQGGLGTFGHAGQDDLDERSTKDEEIEDWRCVEGCPVLLLNEQSGDLQGGASQYAFWSGMGYHGGSGTEADTRVDYPGRGGASRFYYCPKASAEDREEGLEDFRLQRGGPEQFDSRWKEGTGEDRQPTRRNSHPTVKSTELMRWLVRLITPPCGTVLDPFMGSGSTGKAAYLEGLRFIGIEQDESYCQIAARRCAVRQRSLFAATEVAP